MKLEGFRCDGCGVESIEKRGTWHEVRAVRIDHGMNAYGWSASMGGESHYCSKECLLAAIPKWKG